MNFRVLNFFMMLCLVASVVAVAAKPGSGRGLRGFGAQVGITIPSNYDIGFHAGGQIDYEILPMLDFYPSIEFTHAGTHIHYPVYTDEYSINEFTFNGDVRFYPPLNLPVRPFVGGGFALAIINWHYDSPYYHNGFDSHTNYGPAFNFTCGVDFTLNNLVPFVQLKGKLGTGVDMLKMVAGLNVSL